MKINELANSCQLLVTINNVLVGEKLATSN